MICVEACTLPHLKERQSASTVECLGQGHTPSVFVGYEGVARHPGEHRVIWATACCKKWCFETLC